MGRGCVAGLAAKEAAKAPGDPSKVNWNWFCGAGNRTDRDLGWKCAIKHIKGRKVTGDIRREGAASPHTWNKVVLLLNLADIQAHEAGRAVNWIQF